MVAAAGPRLRPAAHVQSAVRTVTLENFRQPAAQPGAGRADAFDSGHLVDRAATGQPRLAAGDRDHHVAGAAIVIDPCAAQAGRFAVADASADRNGGLRPAGRVDISNTGISAL